MSKRVKVNYPLTVMLFDCCRGCDANSFWQHT